MNCPASSCLLTPAAPFPRPGSHPRRGADSGVPPARCWHLGLGSSVPEPLLCLLHVCSSNTLSLTFLPGVCPPQLVPGCLRCPAAPSMVAPLQSCWPELTGTKVSPDEPVMLTAPRRLLKCLLPTPEPSHGVGRDSLLWFVALPCEGRGGPGDTLMVNPAGLGWQLGSGSQGPFPPSVIPGFPPQTSAEHNPGFVSGQRHCPGAEIICLIPLLQEPD